ncbi:hypothetical protein T261_06453 [Streptomyces lydicus]|nr:hypothetical protein T261_06453 [Streptomyces lydicus]
MLASATDDETVGHAGRHLSWRGAGAAALRPPLGASRGGGAERSPRPRVWGPPRHCLCDAITSL